MKNSTFRLALLLGSTASSRGSRAAEGGRLSPMLHGTFNCFVFSHEVIKPNTTTVYFFHALQKVCLQNARNSYLQLPLGAPTLCSLAKPTGTESPPVSPEATSAKPDVPQARILMRGKPSFDSLQSRNVVSLISHPREIEPRIRKK